MVKSKHAATKRNLTGAGYGIVSWLYQRITAVIMLVFLLAFLVFIFNVALNVNSSIASWQVIFNCTLTRVLVQIFVIALVLHAWVGIRDLWMDYIQCNAIKLTLHTLTILWLVGSLLYSVKVLWL
jgi:succinate dehydrogenase / fumarate reductase membrane anchor subunit